MSQPGVSELEAALGRSLPHGERGSIASLNDLPDAVIAEAKRLPSTWLVRGLIEYYCGLACRPYLSAFIEKVVEGGEPANVWRRGDVLVPDAAIADQLCLPRDALLGPIGGFHGERIVPSLESWKAGTAWVGAPAHARPDADYRTPVSAGAVNLVRPKLETAPDAASTVRRWTASRVARVLAPDAARTIDGLFASMPSLPPRDQWSDDGRIAVAALMREYNELAASESEIPGFRGPDEWYG